MKKALLLITAFVLSMNMANAQCTPNTSLTVPGIYPDTITNLPHAIVGHAYSTVIQVRVLTDTVSGTLPITIDYIKITGVTGLPPGYTYACNPGTCQFPGGSNGCVVLSGPAPTAGQAGMTYPIVVVATAHGHITGTIITVPDQSSNIVGYKIVVDFNTGIASLQQDGFEVMQNTPNPFSRNTVIEFNLPSNDKVDFSVVNVLGKVVYNKSINGLQGNNKINLLAKDFGTGIYFYTLRTGSATISRRMIISSN